MLRENNIEVSLKPKSKKIKKKKTSRTEKPKKESKLCNTSIELKETPVGINKTEQIPSDIL